MTELELGEYIVTKEDGGVMAVYLRGIEPGGHVAVFTPGDPVMQAWYPNGYRIGRAHWGELKKVTNG